MGFIIRAAFGSDRAALRIGRRLRQRRCRYREYDGRHRRSKRQRGFQRVDHLKKSLLLSRWSRRFNRSEIAKRLTEKF
jgi:hypothetical protein